jgi:hypothetical protein
LRESQEADEENLDNDDTTKYIAANRLRNRLTLLSEQYPENTAPVDLDEVDVRLQTDDMIDQDEIGAAISRNVIRSMAERDIYQSRPSKVLTLANLRFEMERSLTQQAIAHLQISRSRLQLEDGDQFLHGDPLTIWNTNSDKRLDYICAMGSKVGLHVALPDRPDDCEYELVLNIKPQLAFAGKYAQLGADQTEGLLRIGSRPGEDIYVFMCPREVLEDLDYVPTTPGTCVGKTTRMKTKYSRILTAFIADCLSKMRDVTGIFCNDPYDVPMPPQPMSWGFTNAL